MTVAALISGLGLALLTAAWLLRPFFRAEAVDRGPSLNDPQVAALLARRETLFNALRDLELDRTAGKIDEPTYRRLKVEYGAEAVQILRALREVGVEVEEDAEEAHQVAPADA